MLGTTWGQLAGHLVNPQVEACVPGVEKIAGNSSGVSEESSPSACRNGRNESVTHNGGVRDAMAALRRTSEKRLPSG
jgi:hypothetical protein